MTPQQLKAFHDRFPAASINTLPAFEVHELLAHIQQLTAERDRLREALLTIRDHEAAMVALQDFITIREDLADAELGECSCNPDEFHTCETCIRVREVLAPYKQILDRWGDTWAVMLDKVAALTPAPAARTGGGMSQQDALLLGIVIGVSLVALVISAPIAFCAVKYRKELIAGFEEYRAARTEGE